jgi:hypothetical protein
LKFTGSGDDPFYPLLKETDLLNVKHDRL